MTATSFYWHDYETFGAVPRRDRPAQFAGVRTDAELNPIDEPMVLHCRPGDDSLPEPEACLITGIVPQNCQQVGLSEADFAAAIEQQLARPGTVGVGYNSIRFDDEVTRFLFWRCLIDPYAREWQNECGRWDLLDVLRCAWALRPEGLNWPLNDAGAPSFRLQDLSRANALEHAHAHDALSDVHATLALARRLKHAQPRLWDFCLRLHKKPAVIAEIESAQAQGRPFLHVSGMYGVERGCLALVWPLAPHPVNKNELIVWDLAQDPAALLELNAAETRLRLFSRSDELPAGIVRLPIKTIHLNKSPIVIANLRTLTAERAARWGIDLEQGLRHADTAARIGPTLAGLWSEVYARDAAAPADADESLYDGFVGPADRRTLQALRALSPQRLADRRPDFQDARLAELLLRYRARNFPHTLSAAERQQWLEHCKHRLIGADGQGLQRYEERLAVLAQDADERGRAILAALREHAAALAARVDA